jgi:hypothetical protein
MEAVRVGLDVGKANATAAVGAATAAIGGGGGGASAAVGAGCAAGVAGLGVGELFRVSSTWIIVACTGDKFLDNAARGM